MFTDVHKRACLSLMRNSKHSIISLESALKHELPFMAVSEASCHFGKKKLGMMPHLKTAKTRTV